MVPKKNKRILWTRPNGQFFGYTHTDAYIHINDPVYDVTHGIGLKWVRAHVRPTYDPSASFPFFHSELTPEPHFHSSMLDLLLDFNLNNVSPFSPLIFGSCCLHLCDLQSDWFFWTPDLSILLLAFYQSTKWAPQGPNQLFWKSKSYCKLFECSNWIKSWIICFLFVKIKNIIKEEKVVVIDDPSIFYPQQCWSSIFYPQQCQYSDD